MNDITTSPFLTRISLVAKQRPRHALILCIFALCLFVFGTLLIIFGFESLNDAFESANTALDSHSAAFVVRTLLLSRQAFGFGLILIIMAGAIGGMAIAWFKRIRMYRLLKQSRP